VQVTLAQKGRELEVVVRGRGPAMGEPGFAKVRSVAEGVFSGTVRAESRGAEGTTFTVTLPLPPQRV